MVDPDSLLRRAEIEGERVAAAFRSVIFAAFLAMIVLVGGSVHGFDILVWTAIYGLATAAGLTLAWRGLFHPVIPYLFVTFDVAVVAVQLLLFARALGMPPGHAFAVPVAALVFVIMVHASMRYRPWLVVYAAALFVVTVEAGALAFAADGPAPEHWLHIAHQGGMGEVVLYRAFPATVIGLSALILFIIARRTRRLLVDSVGQAYRVANLSRYFSPNLAERLAAMPDDALLTGRRQQAAVLFVDIRGFTAMAEGMAPEELGAFLSEFRGLLAEEVLAHGGTVDKFIGDAIMAVFGTRVPHADDARRALVCALELLDVVARWSEQRQASGKAPVVIGVGGHYGEVFAGALGDERLLEYTVIGDTVNVAERLERLTRRVDSPFVVSAAFLRGAGDAAMAAGWRRLAAQGLPGHRRPVEAFTLASPPAPAPVIDPGA